jgi:phosphoglucosamine mutase
MALVTRLFHQSGKLRGTGPVATVMSNLGLERFVEGLGLKLTRTAVGDRYVVAHMRAHDCNVGGEQSGHIVLSDYSTTGDGLLAALQVLAAIRQAEKPASEVLHLFDPLPQVLKNYRYEGGSPLDDAGVKKAMAAAERALDGKGRLLVRKSGTEPLIRVMAEGDDPVTVEGIVDQVCDAIRSADRASVSGNDTSRIGTASR